MFRANLKHGRVGEWEIGQQFFGDGVVATALFGNGASYVTDHPIEIASHLEGVIQAAKLGGRILTTGLGLCLFPRMCLSLPNVESVTIIEKSADVIELVGSQVKDDPRIRIIHADAFEWVPADGERFTVVWHDCWLLPRCRDAEFDTRAEKLYWRYGLYCDWQKCWSGDGFGKFYE